MPWADALWAVTYNSHTYRTGTGLGLYRIDDQLNRDNNPLGGQPQSGIWFGKPKGWGGPWRAAALKAGEASDPFLMTGFDKKVLH